MIGAITLQQIGSNISSIIEQEKIRAKTKKAKDYPDNIPISGFNKKFQTGFVEVLASMFSKKPQYSTPSSPIKEEHRKMATDEMVHLFHYLLPLQDKML